MKSVIACSLYPDRNAEEFGLNSSAGSLKDFAPAFALVAKLIFPTPFAPQDWGVAPSA